MASFSTNHGEPKLMKAALLKALAAGERIPASQFKMTFDGESGMEYIVDATQIPPMKRHVMETFGHMGVKINQQGSFDNAGEITVTLSETLTGKALKFVRDAVLQKKYMDITITITPETLAGAEAIEVKLTACFIASDAIDLANESVTEYVKVPLTINFNWIDIK